jgi:hypothetical protein
VVVLALLFSAGFASTYAMPGNPLYSVKRLVERARISFAVGGDSKTSALLSSTEERLDELEFVCSGKKKQWYYSIARDAAGDIERAYIEAGHASADARGRFRERARSASRRLESLLPSTLPALSQPEQESLDGCLNRMRRRLGSQSGGSYPGTDVGSSGGPCQNGSSDSTCPKDSVESYPDSGSRNGQNSQGGEKQQEQVQEQQGTEQGQDSSPGPVQQRGSEVESQQDMSVEQESRQNGPGPVEQDLQQDSPLRDSGRLSPR